MKDIQSGSSILVGTPSNVKHHVHVDFNSETGFEGLPAEWKTWLINSGIEKKDIIENSSTMLEVLQYKAESNISLKDLCSDSSNKDLYADLAKIGEGAGGEVFIATSRERNIQVAGEVFSAAGEVFIATSRERNIQVAVKMKLDKYDQIRMNRQKKYLNQPTRRKHQQNHKKIKNPHVYQISRGKNSHR